MLKSKTKKTIAVLVLLAILAGGAAALYFAFARRPPATPAAPEPEPWDPQSYVYDKAFMDGLAAERAKQSALIRERNAIADKMVAMVEAKKAELKTEDLAKVKAALDADPAWQELYACCTNANAKVEAHRRRVFGVVRERITPRKPMKPQAAGPSAAKSLSK